MDPPSTKDRADTVRPVNSNGPVRVAYQHHAGYRDLRRALASVLEQDAPMRQAKSTGKEQASFSAEIPEGDTCKQQRGLDFQGGEVPTPETE